MRGLILGLAICLLWARGSDAQVRGGTYYNGAFGFSAKVPAKWKACENGWLTTDHGIALLQDRRKPCAVSSSLEGPSISFSAIRYENWVSIVEDNPDLAFCNAEEQNKTVELSQPPGGLSIPGLEFIVCQSNLSKEILKLRVLYLNGQKSNDPLAWTHLELWLITKASRFKTDLETFRGVLASVRFDP